MLNSSIFPMEEYLSSGKSGTLMRSWEEFAFSFFIPLSKTKSQIFQVGLFWKKFCQPTPWIHDKRRDKAKKKKKKDQYFLWDWKLWNVSGFIVSLKECNKQIKYYMPYHATQIFDHTILICRTPLYLQPNFKTYFNRVLMCVIKYIYRIRIFNLFSSVQRLYSL